MVFPGGYNHDDFGRAYSTQLYIFGVERRFSHCGYSCKTKGGLSRAVGIALFVVGATWIDVACITYDAADGPDSVLGTQSSRRSTIAITHVGSVIGDKPLQLTSSANKYVDVHGSVYIRY